ncbi:hypothetical protein AGENTSMITH_55 [Bacillus phage vB_BspM_AgentSmith]|nr:hypothetical protein AGENTSMITH_55 [Bacillus phage vB_BspM_AgentSmith]
MTILHINKHYSFSVYANSILGTNYKNAKLVAILDYRTALRFENIDLVHKQIYPYLPPSTLIDHTKYTFYLFTVDDKSVVIADTWINQNSIEETTGQSYTVKLNNVTTHQLNIIRDQLRLIGVSFDIS